MAVRSPSVATGTTPYRRRRPERTLEPGAESRRPSRLGFNRTRITQLFDLTLLAPDIQEQLQTLEAVDGVEPITERAVRRLVRAARWAEQRDAWKSWRLDDAASVEPDLVPT